MEEAERIRQAVRRIPDAAWQAKLFMCWPQKEARPCVRASAVRDGGRWTNDVLVTDWDEVFIDGRSVGEVEGLFGETERRRRAHLQMTKRDMRRAAVDRLCETVERCGPVGTSGLDRWEQH